jgi:hypothetical protein
MTIKNYVDPRITIDPLVALTKDVREATALLSVKEARFLVDYYYLTQEDRKRSSNQVRAVTLDAEDDNEEPHLVLDWLATNTATLERNIQRALGAYSQGNPVGRWAESIVGIGPVISAGLLAHIDIEQAPTVGHIWRFAGQDPTQEWKGKASATVAVNAHLGDRTALTVEDVYALAEQVAGLNASTVLKLATSNKDGSERKLTKETLSSALAIRPWNGKLKTLCWKIGESFVKVSNNSEDIYGHVYAERKALETARNEELYYSKQAETKLVKQRIGKTTEAYKAYSQGKLPPAHIHARAKRWAVKLFLAHWHHVAYEIRYDSPPPKPYILNQEGHTHYIAPPNWGV